MRTIVRNTCISGLNDGKESTHTKKEGNLSIQNQLRNIFSLNLYLWRHFPVSSDCLLSVGRFASIISNFLIQHMLQHFCPGLQGIT